MGDDELDFQTSLETSQLGASTAKHEHITLPPSPTPDDDSKTQDIIGELPFSINRHFSVNRRFRRIDTFRKNPHFWGIDNFRRIEIFRRIDIFGGSTFFGESLFSENRFS